MRNRRNANFYEGDKNYNTNQNNTNISNLDNNHGKKYNRYSVPLSEAEISSEFVDDVKENYESGKKYYNKVSSNKDKNHISS